MASNRINEKGFTYLEAMIVVMIIGLFASLALPAFNNILSKERLRSAARTITVHLREIQQLAIAKEETLKVVFTIGDFDKGTESGTYYRVQAGAHILEQKKLPDDILINAAAFGEKAVLNFYPLGTATPGRIMLKSRKGDLFYVIVNSVGRVRTSNVPPEY